MPEHRDLLPEVLHPGDLLLAGGRRGAGQERGGAQVPAADQSSPTGPQDCEDDGEVTEPTVLLRAPGGGGGHRPRHSVGRPRHQAEEERAGREEQRDGGAELCRGEQPQDPGQTGGEGGGAAGEGEEAPGELPAHHGRSRQVS